jgi:hypothetical protein
MITTHPVAASTHPSTPTQTPAPAPRRQPDPGTQGGMRSALAVCLLVVAGPLSRVAAADDKDDVAFESSRKVNKYIDTLEGAKEEVFRASLPAKDCTDAVDRARKARLTKLVHPDYIRIGGARTKENDSQYEITLERADQLCAEYAQWYAVGRNYDLLQRIKLRMGTLDAAPAPSVLQAMVEMGNTCSKAVDEMVAAGVPPTFAFNLDGKPYTVADLKPKICDAVIIAVNQHIKDSAAAQQKDEERFTKVGIKGDKLALMVRYDGGVFLAGGGEDPTFKKYAPASLLFVWLQSDADAAGYVVHTIRRYKFAGNKLLGTTEKTYRKHKGERPGNVFR